MNTTPSETVRRRRIHAKPTAPAIADDAVVNVLELHDEPADGLSTVDPEMRHEMVATAAYFIAEQRGFAPGHELEDWRMAEETVNAALLTSQQRS